MVFLFLIEVVRQKMMANFDVARKSPDISEAHPNTTFEENSKKHLTPKA